MNPTDDGAHKDPPVSLWNRVKAYWMGSRRIAVLNVPLSGLEKNTSPGFGVDFKKPNISLTVNADIHTQPQQSSMFLFNLYWVHIWIKIEWTAKYPSLFPESNFY